MSLMIFADTINVSGQAIKNDQAVADNYFNYKRYAEALPYYLSLLKTSPSNGKFNFRTGVCYWNSRSQKIKAISFLEKSISLTQEARDSSYTLFEAFELLGDVYHHLYKFDEAISYYEKCEKLMDKKNEKKEAEEIGGKMEMCKIGKALKGLATTSAVKINNNDKNVFSNSSSALSKDKSTITFTFKLNESKGKNDYDSRYFEGAIIEKDDSSKIHKTIQTPAKKKNMYEATIATSVDGQIVLTYRDEGGVAFLYTSALKGNHWTVPEKLNKPANLSGWEPNEFISADGSTMYFVSDRKGGYGGKDIYQCKKLENGEWSKAINMGPSINTSYDEEAPFIHPDGKTFFFSSNGFNKEGNFEILNCIFASDSISPSPVKVGFPIDTTNDEREVLLAKPVQQENVNYRRHKKNSSEQVDNKDNYIISFSNPNGIPLTLVKGTIIENSSVSTGPVKIEIRNNENEEILGCYLAEAYSHEFAFLLPPSKNNNISFQKKGFIIQSENLDISDNKNYYKRLDPIIPIPVEKDAKVILTNIFFEDGKPIIRAISKAELNNCIQFMNDNADLSFEIIGIAECGSNLRENSRLCTERAESIVNYFKEKGIDKERLNAKGYALKLRKTDHSVPSQKIEFRIINEEPKTKLFTTQ